MPGEPRRAQDTLSNYTQRAASHSGRLPPGQTGQSRPASGTSGASQTCRNPVCLVLRTAIQGWKYLGVYYQAAVSPPLQRRDVLRQPFLYSLWPLSAPESCLTQSVEYTRNVTEQEGRRRIFRLPSASHTVKAHSRVQGRIAEIPEQSNCAGLVSLLRSTVVEGAVVAPGD